MLNQQCIKPDIGRLHVIVCGTDPESALGGIGVVMPGYLAALETQEISYEMLPTFRPGSISGKWLPWIQALPRLVAKIRTKKAGGHSVVIYSHSGALPSMFREFVLTALGRMAGARVVIQTHSPEMAGYLDNRLQRSLVRLFFSPADIVCALTPWWRDQLEKAGVCRVVEVVPNPLPPDLHEQALTPVDGKSETADVSVLTMSRLVAGKGTDVAIRAMAETQGPAHLIVAGDGAQRESLTRLAEQLGVKDRVDFVGWVSGEEKRALLRRADLFCLPSTYDVFPMSVVEAFVFGVPVVASRWGGIPDLVIDGEIGALTEPGSAPDVAKALERLSSPALRREMGEKAKRRMLELCATDNVGARLKAVLGRLIR